MTDRLFSDCCYGTEQQHAGYEPCPQLDWKSWEGGDCPFDRPKVEVQMRSGGLVEGYADTFDWVHENGPFDVLAYRVVSKNDAQP
jgi:hypothetical protein